MCMWCILSESALYYSSAAELITRVRLCGRVRVKRGRPVSALGSSFLARGAEISNFTVLVLPRTSIFIFNSWIVDIFAPVHFWSVQCCTPKFRSYFATVKSTLRYTLNFAPNN